MLPPTFEILPFSYLLPFLSFLPFLHHRRRCPSIPPLLSLSSPSFPYLPPPPPRNKNHTSLFLHELKYSFFFRVSIFGPLRGNFCNWKKTGGGVLASPFLHGHFFSVPYSLASARTPDGKEGQERREGRGINDNKDDNYDSDVRSK